ncbi:MAG: hypothetical protein IJ363_01700, partial [Clostridia bacterium]|nr:hypothetical protein [Clostridia bacterium]
MSRENELLDPRTPEDESTPTAHDHESEAINGSIKETAPAKHTESDHPLEQDMAHGSDMTAVPAFTGGRFDYTEGEYSDAPDEEADHVDIYAEPAELYEDADEDEILDAEEEITEETVEEAIEEAIEEVEADIEEEEEILAEQRPQEMERKFEYLENLLDTRHYADFRDELAEL